MKIYSPYTYDPEVFRQREHVDFPPSITVEDDSITIRELVDRYVRGLDTGLIAKDSVDDGISDSINDFGDETTNLVLDYASLDLTEIDDIRRHLNARAKELRDGTASVDSPAQSSDVPSLGQGDSESSAGDKTA